MPERFGAALGVEGIAVQEPSYTDLEELATLLQHVGGRGHERRDDPARRDRQRPADRMRALGRGARPGEGRADKNLVGDHYRRLATSGAFLRAGDFDELVAGIDAALAEPSTLRAERERIAAELVGTVDGRAAERVVAAISAALPHA